MRLTKTSVLLFLVASAVVLATCGATPSPTSPTNVVATSARTRSASAETFEPISSDSSIQRAQSAGDWYQVVNVGDFDTLNLRISPSPTASVVGTVPRTARGIRATGESQRVGERDWLEVVYRGRRGWVNSAFVQRDAAYGYPTLSNTGARFAVVVGVSSYGGTLDPLDNPARDARSIAETLAHLGFRVRLLTDPDASQIRSELQWLAAQRAGEIEAVLFYFAGHGLSLRGQSALVALPPAGQPSRLENIDQQLILLRDIARVMEASPARSKLVILDACRNTPRFVQALHRSQDRTIAEAATGLGRVAAGRDFLVVYSTDPQNVAADGPRDRHSPFTGALLARMVEPDVPINEALRLTRQDVVTLTSGAQSPWVEENLTADFTFAPLPTITPEHFFGGLDAEHSYGTIGSDGTIIRHYLTNEAEAELTAQTCGGRLRLTAGEQTAEDVISWINAHNNDMYGIYNSDYLIQLLERIKDQPGHPKIAYLETACTETGRSISHFDLGGGSLVVIDFTREGDYGGWNIFFVSLSRR